MTKTVALSKKWTSHLISLPETGMGYQVITVVLKDGQKFDGVVIDSGRITRVRGHKEIPFAEQILWRLGLRTTNRNWKEVEISS